MIGHEDNIAKLVIVEVLQEFEGIAPHLRRSSKLALLSFDWNLGRWAKIMIELVRRTCSDAAPAVDKKLLEIPLARCNFRYMRLPYTVQAAFESFYYPSPAKYRLGAGCSLVSDRAFFRSTVLWI